MPYFTDEIIKCKKCEEHKGRENYYFGGSSDGGPPPLCHRVCRECVSKRAKQRYKEKREKLLSGAVEYHWKNRKMVLGKKRHKRTGWTSDRYDLYLAKQNGECAVKGCGRPLQVADHCHQTNKPRELLCSNCNLALGLLGDNPARTRGLSGYISKWNRRLKVGPRA